MDIVRDIGVLLGIGALLGVGETACPWISGRSDFASRGHLCACRKT